MPLLCKATLKTRSAFHKVGNIWLFSTCSTGSGGNLIGPLPSSPLLKSHIQLSVCERGFPLQTFSLGSFPHGPLKRSTRCVGSVVPVMSLKMPSSVRCHFPLLKSFIFSEGVCERKRRLCSFRSWIAERHTPPPVSADGRLEQRELTDRVQSMKWTLFLLYLLIGIML